MSMTRPSRSPDVRTTGHVGAAAFAMVSEGRDTFLRGREVADDWLGRGRVATHARWSYA